MGLIRVLLTGSPLQDTQNNPPAEQPPRLPPAVMHAILEAQLWPMNPGVVMCSQNSFSARVPGGHGEPPTGFRVFQAPRRHFSAHWVLSWGRDTQQVTGTSLSVCILTRDLQRPGRTKGCPRKSSGRAGSVARGLGKPRLEAGRKERPRPHHLPSQPSAVAFEDQLPPPPTHTPPLDRKKKKEMK